MLKPIPTFISFSDQQDGCVFESRAIEHEGKLVLVSSWLVSNETGEQIPERIVHLPPHLSALPEGQETLLLTLPKSVMDGQTIEMDGYRSENIALASTRGSTSLH